MSFNLNKVLISDAVDVSCRQILEEGGIIVDYRAGISKDELLNIIKDYEGLIVRSSTKVTAEVIQAGTRLKLIGRAGTGVDNIDLNAATANGVIVMNTPGGNTISAAEHTCALVSSLARNIPQGCASLKEGKWDRKKFMGVELEGKTLGIIGLGRIGREVALRMQSFGMKTVGYDPIVPAEEAAKFNVEFLELEEMWPVIDFVTVHTPLIPQTRGLINDVVFGKCKKGVRVINVARGGIIDESALLRALESGQCGGAGLDVYSEEPPKSDALWSLIKHPNVVSTPHLGASTKEAQLKVAREIAEQFVAAVKGEGLVGVVNVPRVAVAMASDVAPWLLLVTRLTNLLVSSLNGETPTGVTVNINSGKLKQWSEVIERAVLVGCFNGEKRINVVNVKSLVAKTAVTVVGGEGVEGVSVTCEGFTLDGNVLCPVPILTGINGTGMGLVELSGRVLVFKGVSPGDVIKTVDGINEVHSSGEYTVVKTTSQTVVAKETNCIAWFNF